jgi:uncharacterized protein (DUF1778 family)
LNQFIIQSALEKAQSIIEQERVLNLTQKDADVFFKAIENPPQPNKELVKAAMAYKREFLDD